MTKQIKGVPGNMSAAHIAGRTIYARGPSSKEQVLSYTSFGATSGAQDYNLGKAISTGWFVDLGGMIDLSDRAKHYYAGTEPEPKAMGSLATPRENVNAGLPMSAKHRPDTRGRRDVPDYSVRAIPSTYAKVTP